MTAFTPLVALLGFATGVGVCYLFLKRKYNKQVTEGLKYIVEHPKEFQEEINTLKSDGVDLPDKEGEKSKRSSVDTSVSAALSPNTEKVKDEKD